MQIHQLTSFTEQDFRDLAALMKELSDRLELTEEHLRDVVVAAEFRGRHIGRTLLEHVLGTARTMAPIELQLTSKPARTAANALYSTLGFTRVDTNCYRIKL